MVVLMVGGRKEKHWRGARPTRDFVVKRVGFTDLSRKQDHGIPPIKSKDDMTVTIPSSRRPEFLFLSPGCGLPSVLFPFWFSLRSSGLTLS